MTSDSAHHAYQQIEVAGSNRLQLVVMLYDGAIRFLGDAKLCAEKKDPRGRTTAINRALAILGELQSTLKLDEGGEVAQSLDQLYTYMTERILDSNIKGKTDGIDESIRLLRILNTAWTEVSRKAANGETAADKAPPPVPSVGNTGVAKPALEFFG